MRHVFCQKNEYKFCMYCGLKYIQDDPDKNVTHIYLFGEYTTIMNIEHCPSLQDAWGFIKLPDDLTALTRSPILTAKK